MPLATEGQPVSHPSDASEFESNLFAEQVTAVHVLESEHAVHEPLGTLGQATHVGSPETDSPSVADDEHEIVPV